MEITASRGRFMVAMFRMGDWKYEWNNDRTLSIWGASARPIGITTYRGDFIEAIDVGGNVLADGGDGDWFYVNVTKKKTKLRFKKLPDPKLSKSEIDKARGKTTITVVDQERYDKGPFDFGASYTDGSFVKVLKSLEKIRDSVPKEYLAKARCEIDSESGYEGSHYARVRVTYARPETDKEVIGRVQVERERARLAERKDRAQLKNLQSKLSVAQ